MSDEKKTYKFVCVVCGYEVEDPNGVEYWVFAAQITIA